MSPALPRGELRPAAMADVRAIHALLQEYAEQGLLLGRSLSSLYDHLRDYLVFSVPAGQGVSELAGVCSLHICWEDLAEVRSLAVAAAWQGRGIGSALVCACIEEAARLGIGRVFTLTYQPEFFRRLGFTEADKNDLPHKVWNDCINCPKFPDCNEIAMIRGTSGRNP